VPGHVQESEVAFYSGCANTSDAAPQSANSTLLYYSAKCTCGFELPSHCVIDNCWMPPGGLSPNEAFLGTEVTFATSAVHVPLDVYIEGE